jgi:hypothetical protein
VNPKSRYRPLLGEEPIAASKQSRATGKMRNDPNRTPARTEMAPRRLLDRANEQT